MTQGRSGGRSLLWVLTLCMTSSFGVGQTALAQTGSERVEWNKPVEPFKVIGNVYYVGAAGVRRDACGR